MEWLNPKWSTAELRKLYARQVVNTGFDVRDYNEEFGVEEELLDKLKTILEPVKKKALSVLEETMDEWCFRVCPTSAFHRVKMMTPFLVHVK